MRHFGQTLKLHAQINHSSKFLLVDDAFAGGSNWSTLRNASSFASRATSASRGRVLMFHLYVHGRSECSVFEHSWQVTRKSSSPSSGRAAEHTSALSLLFLTSHRVLSFCCITDLSCLLYESRAYSCKFCFDLFRTIKLWLCQSDITAELVWSIFNGSTWGVTFQWLRPCSINTTQKNNKNRERRLLRDCQEKSQVSFPTVYNSAGILQVEATEKTSMTFRSLRHLVSSSAVLSWAELSETCDKLQQFVTSWTGFISVCGDVHTSHVQDGNWWISSLSIHPSVYSVHRLVV